MITGRMDRLVVIQYYASTGQDDYGATTYSWTTFTTIWAERRDLNTRERLQAGQTNAAINAFYFCQYGPGASITEKMRLVDGSQTYEILGVPVEIGRKEGWRLEVGTI